MVKLSLENQRLLLDLAVQAVRAVVEGNALPAVPSEADFNRADGAFVTLRRNLNLRGCVGRLHPPSLPETIRDCAVSAATSDPRFAPIAREELIGLDLEISVLGGFMALQEPRQIVIGQHGLLFQMGVHRGLLLPQVATEFRVDAEGFLDLVSRKAGLEAGAWRRASIELFTTQSFAREI